MDFSKYELSDELRAALEKDYSDSVAGLKSKNSELIEREKKLKEANEGLTLEMSTKEEDAKVQLAEKEGTVEQYKNAVAERDEKIATIQREFKEAQNKSLIESAVSEFSAGLANDPAGRMYMQKLFTDSVDVVDGQVKPKDITIDLDSLKKGLLSDEANAKYVAANVGSGTGSAGSSSSGSASASKKAYSEMSKAEKLEYYESKM